MPQTRRTWAKSEEHSEWSAKGGRGGRGKPKPCPTAAERGHLGGLARSQAKTEAARINGQKGGRPPLPPKERAKRLQARRQKWNQIRRERYAAEKKSLRPKRVLYA